MLVMPRSRPVCTRRSAAARTEPTGPVLPGPVFAGAVLVGSALRGLVLAATRAADAVVASPGLAGIGAASSDEVSRSRQRPSRRRPPPSPSGQVIRRVEVRRTDPRRRGGGAAAGSRGADVIAVTCASRAVPVAPPAQFRNLCLHLSRTFAPGPAGLSTRTRGPSYCPCHRRCAG